MKLTKKIINSSKVYKTPFLLIDLQQVRKNYRTIQKGLPDIEVFYSMKANAHPKIIEALVKEKASFDITSEEELKLLSKYNLPDEKIICLNPIKSPQFLKTLHKEKVSVLAFDSFEEVDKIAQYARGSKVVLRIVVDNEGSDWPLTKKYGIDPAEAIPLLKYAKEKNLEPIGLTFHVGSQCRNKNNWVNALFVCETLWSLAKKEDIYFYFLSLGGGLPIQHTKPIPALEDIEKGIKRMLRNNYKTLDNPLRVTIEPGRAIVGDSAVMVTSVIGKAKRGNENWAYIDAGVFNAFMETIDGFTYELKTEKDHKKKKYTIGGPSCDSVDIPFKNIKLSDVNIDDKVYVLNAGAYTTVYASNFNGFGIPKVYFLNK
ncbi:MAG TPA: type III PLP-dependent enzyme [Candidatus Saccharimonadales bacterium]|nr:type III PLP-dependent enzyme [Candidatus Saccharimonadales bacterium]